MPHFFSWPFLVASLLVALANAKRYKPQLDLQMLEEDVEEDGGRDNRRGHGEEEALGAHEEEGHASAASSGGAYTCQYAGQHNVRPDNKVLIAVCPNGNAKCLKHKVYGNMIEAKKNSTEVSVADCEQLCTTGVTGNQIIGELRGKCLGYVIRPRDPKHEKDWSTKPNCWLIPAHAPRSKKYRDEVKLADIAQFGHGLSATDKRTFLKYSCDCSARFVHIQMPPDQIQLALLTTQLKNLKPSTSEQFQRALSKGEGPDAALEAYTKERQLLAKEVDALNATLAQSIELGKLTGVFDFLPAVLPHRIYKGLGLLVPNGLLNKMFSIFKGKLKNQAGQFTKYLESPVRITQVYKKTDLSALLYRCLNKSTLKESTTSPPSWTFEEHWYIVPKEMLIAAAAQLLHVPETTLQADIKDSKELQVALFFRLSCLGYRVDDEGYLHDPSDDRRLTARVNPGTLSSKRTEEGWEHGCFRDGQMAAKMEQAAIVKEVLAVAGPDYKPAKLMGNDLCSRLIDPDMDFLRKLDSASAILEWQKTLSVVAASAQAVNAVAQKAKGVWQFLTGKQADEDQARARSQHTRREASSSALVNRTHQLVAAMKEITIRLSAIQNVDDVRLKLFCAKEMLEAVQNAGGIWPKISQNLAMRPDLVKDDYARNKLKETQSGNKDRGRDYSMAFVDRVNPKVDLPGVGPTPITKFLECNSFLSAGSVGQVDVYTLRKDTLDARALAGVFLSSVLPADWAGNKTRFIVKTVFEETEDMYIRDWKLMETFFGLGSQYGFLDSGYATIWAVLKNLETSIFDEFDLRNEATFTTKGRQMLHALSDVQSDNVKLTTPVGIATDSKYFMIQTFAQGVPLSSYLEQVKGQWERLAEWRVKIYHNILTVFGYTAIQHGFFQSDPHPGNWFWDEETETLSLIDWGGVEDWTKQKDLQQGHCNLARLYSSLGQFQSLWSACDAVVVEDTNDKRAAMFAGVYRRTAVSIHQVKGMEEELLFGHSYALSYMHESKPLSLWYNGEGHWEIAKVELPTPEVTSMEAALVKVKGLVAESGIPGSTQGPNGDQSFFGRVAGKLPHEMAGHAMETTWKLKDKKEITLMIRPGWSAECGERMDRTQSYALAAVNLGISLQTTCKAFKLLEITDTRVKAALRTDPVPLVCIKVAEDGGLVGRVGMPPQEFEAELSPGADEAVALMIKVPRESCGGTTCSGGEMDVITQRLTTDTTLAQELAKDRLARLSPSPRTALTDDGVGKLLAAEEEGRPGVQDHGPFAQKGQEALRSLVYDQALRVYATSTSLFDSDVAEAALLALQARQGLALFSVKDLPQVYTLFARCVLVFHGMIADVVKENALRLVPIQSLQWLLRSWGDRFFEAWKGYADAYLKESREQCPVGQWEDLQPRIGTAL